MKALDLFRDSKVCDHLPSLGMYHPPAVQRAYDGFSDTFLVTVVLAQKRRTPVEVKGERLKVKLQSPGPHAGSFGSAGGSQDTLQVLHL